MSKYLSRHIKVIFLMMGNSCNMNCRYCMQHDLVSNPIAVTVNPDIIEFIKEVAKENKGVNVQFYGGEPLLYFKAIKEVVKELEGADIRFSCLSNGKAVTDEIVKFFNDRKLPFGVSWDGKNVLETRRYDVFNKVDGLREKLMKFDYLGLSAVLTGKSYPNDIIDGFLDLDREYFSIHKYHLRFNTDLVFNTGSLPDDLSKIDYSEVERQMFHLMNWYLKKRTSSKPYPRDDELAKYVFVDLLVQKISDFYCSKGSDGKMHNVLSSCGNGYWVLNLDLDGNLYPCHNVSKPCGTIYDSFFAYLSKVVETDKVILRKDECSKCLAVALVS